MSLVDGPDSGQAVTQGIQVTVAICTWNRCELLRQTLEQMTRLLIPVGLEYEILIVDNNSTDATEQVVTDFAGRLPVRRIFESRPGKSFACNRAMEEARGDYILWTDDDVLVAETWLAAFMAGAQQFPDAAAFGGTIVPWFTAPPDPEMCDAFPALGTGFCGLERTMSSGVLSDEEHIWGANMAFRRRAVEGLSFDTAFGPSPYVVGGGRDEVTFIRQLRRKGGIVIWLPAMRVQHYVMPSRTTLKYLKSFYWTKAIRTNSGSASERSRSENVGGCSTMALAAVADGDASLFAVDNRMANSSELAIQKWPSGERVLIGTSSFFDLAPGVCLPSGHDRWISKPTPRRGAPDSPTVTVRRP